MAHRSAFRDEIASCPPLSLSGRGSCLRPVTPRAPCPLVTQQLAQRSDWLLRHRSARIQVTLILLNNGPKMLRTAMLAGRGCQREAIKCFLYVKRRRQHKRMFWERTSPFTNFYYSMWLSPFSFIISYCPSLTVPNLQIKLNHRYVRLEENSVVRVRYHLPLAINIIELGIRV